MVNSTEAGARGRGRQLALTTIVHEQTQSNRTCHILQFCCLKFQGFYFLSLVLNIKIFLVHSVFSILLIKNIIALNLI